MKPSGIGGQEMDGATGKPQPAARTAASRVVPVGSASHPVAPTFGLKREPGNDDVTTVDGAFEPLTREQREALARRIRSELEHTRPLGTPRPAPVQHGPSTPPHAFKQTMLLGVARSPSSSPPPASVAPSPEPASVRASFVRVVGPPTSPPPRRSRRTEPPAPPEPEGGAASRAPDSEPDHEAFRLDRRSSVGMLAASPPAARASSPNGGSVILPPPPQPGDYEVSSPSSFPPAVVRAELQRSGTMLAPERASEPVGARRVARGVEPLADLPSVDPFAGFVAQPPSFLERWLVVLVVALALVGAAALAAIALGYLGRPSP